MVTWADEQLVLAAWISAGTSVASLLAAIVVGVFVARTFTATRQAAAASLTAAEAAGQQARSAEEALAHEREVASANARSAERSRIDGQMPTVTIRVTPREPTCFAITATDDSVLGSFRPSEEHPGYQMLSIAGETTIKIDNGGQRDEAVWFREYALITLTNHSDQPARVNFLDPDSGQMSISDGRELSPMYLAPGEEVTSKFHRRRSLDQVLDDDAGPRSDQRLSLQWGVGDIRQDAEDLYSATVGMAYYSGDRSAILVASRPRNARSRHVVAIPHERVYLREDQSG